MCLSAAADYLLEAFLQPEDYLLLVQLEIEVVVNNNTLFRAKPNNNNSSRTEIHGTGTTSIIDLLSSSNSSSEGDTSLGSLWNEEDNTEHSSDSAGSSSNYFERTVGNPRKHIG